MSNNSDPVSELEGGAQEPKLRTPLMTALETSNLDELHQLLSSGADLNSPVGMITLSELSSEVPSYPLIWAVNANNTEAVRLLLDNGADPNVCCEYVNGSRACWFHPLYYAAHPDIVNMLIDAGADMNAQNRWLFDTETALLRAAYYQPSVGELLIERGANVDMTDETNCTALYRALSLDHYELVARLVQAGADIERCPSAGFTPLMLALNRKAPNWLIQLLLSSGADPHHGGDYGQTPFQRAVHERNIWAIKWLVRENVDIETLRPLGLEHGESKPALQYLLDLCDEMLAIQLGSKEHISAVSNLLHVMQVLTLAGANQVGNSPTTKQTRTQLIERLNSITLKSLDLSKDPNFLTYDMIGEDLREIRVIVHTLTDILSCPLSLKHLCRVQLRKSLGREFRRKLPKLNIPLPIQEYLRVYNESDIAS